MRKIAESAVKHRRRIIAVWLLVLIAGGALATFTTGRLTVDFSLPGQPGDTASHAVISTFGTAGQNSSPLIVAVTLPPGQRVEDHAAQLKPAFEVLATVRMYDQPVQVFDAYNTVDGTDRTTFATADGRTAMAYVFYPITRTPTPTSPADMVGAAITPLLPVGATLGMTGTDALAASQGSGIGLGVILELLIAGGGALLVLAFVFGSRLAVLPLIVASVSIPGALLLLLPLTYISDYSFIVQYLISLVGLGLGIDYSLLVVTRWREERGRGLDNDAAIVTALRTAGTAVVHSGVTVAIGLLSLVVLPVPFMRSIGIAGALIPLVTVLATLTLTPAILSVAGPRLDPRGGRRTAEGTAWTRWTAFVVRRRWIAAGVALAVLGLLTVPFTTANIGFSAADSLAQRGPAYDTYTALKDQGVPAGTLSPIEILTRSDKARAVAAELSGIDGVKHVVVAADTDSHLHRPLSGDGPTVTMVLAIPQDQTVNQRTVAVVDRVRDKTEHLDGVIGVTGVGTAQTDFQHAVYDNFPLVLLVLSLLTYLLLVRAFRSLLLPLKAVVMNLLSLAAAIGAMVFFWQDGVGSELIYGISATHAVAVWIPPLVFAFLFGLSMDYEVFILARVQEEYRVSGSTDQAVIAGMSRVGRLVTSAALILFLSFAALSTGPGTDQKVLAVGLGLGILLDATVIRSLLLPATISLMGRWNWYLPKSIERLLMLPPLPAAEVRQDDELNPVPEASL
ncbi:MMPL family transporter [Nocardia sp. SYP-A9097]|uniref:MMPL family transporter n=1 Tax=Nocardia sp. SYP-A9097 TaxID=2663237 RepID=UPI00129B96FA|nr:MMPL family transporter [Nocardia sp. SYP-A9097]MRH87961.1 MMPL family transporter [Nocardia sp. SYP-A9097]